MHLNPKLLGEALNQQSPGREGNDFQGQVALLWAEWPLIIEKVRFPVMCQAPFAGVERCMAKVVRLRTGRVQLRHPLLHVPWKQDFFFFSYNYGA